MKLPTTRREAIVNTVATVTTAAVSNIIFYPVFGWWRSFFMSVLCAALTLEYLSYRREPHEKKKT